MPVRDKAVDTAFNVVMGDTPRHFYNHPRHPTATIDGVEMPREEFNKRFIEPLERAYERVVESIDWKRVLLEASARHIALEHEDGDYGFICSECLNESLLADDTHNDWKRNPRAPRYYDRKEPADD